MKKQFDCVEFMHHAAERIYKETKGMSIERELEYWRKKDVDKKSKSHSISRTRLTDSLTL